MSPETPRPRQFFVMQVPAESADRDRLYEVQLLNSDGVALEIGRIDDQTETLVLGGEPVSPDVLTAARRRAVGDGDYVDDAGRSVKPF